MLITAVLIDDNEITNDSLVNITNGPGRAVTKNYKLVKLQEKCYESTIIRLLQHDFH